MLGLYLITKKVSFSNNSWSIDFFNIYIETLSVRNIKSFPTKNFTQIRYTIYIIYSVYYTIYNT